MKRYLLLLLVFISIQTVFAQSTPPPAKAIRLVDKQINLAGTLSGETAQQFIGLDANDKIIINCTRLSRKGSLGLVVKDLNKGTELYKKDGFDTLRNESVTIPARGIYAVVLKTGSLIDKDVQLAIDRIAASPAVKTVKPLYDTIATEVLRSTVRVFTKNSAQGNKAVINISLPPDASYWTFWIGAGKDAVTKMKAFDASCATVGSLYPVNPLVLYGRKYITALPMVPPNALVSYHFMDTPNTMAFKNNQQYSFYTFKSAERITTEYSFMMNHQRDLNLGITNESSNIPQDVEVRVVAFTVTAKGK